MQWDTGCHKLDTIHHLWIEVGVARGPSLGTYALAQTYSSNLNALLILNLILFMYYLDHAS